METEQNGTIMQYFEWELPTGILWKQVAQNANELAQSGISAVWLPPAYKGKDGNKDVGYAVYDLYDLGEFDQKGSIETKYGTKEEYLEAVEALHIAGLAVYADIVLDHKLGADELEWVSARAFAQENRCDPISDEEKILAWTKFIFPGRAGKYSGFQWNNQHFAAVDWDDNSKRSAIFQIKGKQWQDEVDKEFGNFDYLMGACIDLCNEDVVQELYRWGKWYIEETGIDGFRIDAVKHMRFSFFKEWLEYLRAETQKNLFAVGEYWNGDVKKLLDYLAVTQGALSLFDVPLHFKFRDASKAGNAFDMRTIFNDTLVKTKPLLAVPFVDNHDTQPGQSLESWVDDWFKPLAYALILLRRDGYPCVFYGDYYGISTYGIDAKQEWLTPMMQARKKFAYGEQHDYFDDMHLIGWTREGSELHPNSALAVVMTNERSGVKRMYVGKQFAGRQFYDILGYRQEILTIDHDGCAEFMVNDGSVSVWALVS